ncbi:MAG: sigma-70 family RNA polymerase sigma factor, partial [Woeseiaceae bacterium]|nr:sigma-70 family RNA polymerase sigma factor [Woeseiaceae bacterium]
KAMRGIAGYRGESALFTWLCAICRNDISDWRERQGRYREHVVLVEDLPEVAGAIDSWHAPKSETPEHEYQRAEGLRLIQVALDRLPAKYGNVLEWKYVEGHSVKEIAARLDVGTEAAQSLLARAKRAFADVYGTLERAVKDNRTLVKS